MARLNLGSGADARDDHINVERYRDSSHHTGATDPPDVFADAHHLPFADASVDHIRAAHVIEHLRHPLRALEECHRVLQPGGDIYTEVPNPFELKEERDDHLYSWSKATLVNIHREAGFTTVDYGGAPMSVNHKVMARK